MHPKRSHYIYADLPNLDMLFIPNTSQDRYPAWKKLQNKSTFDLVGLSKTESFLQKERGAERELRSQVTGQSVCLLYKHEDLPSIPGRHMKKPGTVAHTYNPSTEEAETGGSCLDSYLASQSSWFWGATDSVRSYKTRWKLEKKPDVDLCLPICKEWENHK